MNIEQLQLALGKDLASKILSEFSETEEYHKIMESDQSFKDKKTTIVLEVYDRIQETRVSKKTVELQAASKNELLREILQAFRDVRMFETNLYAMNKLSGDSERLDTISNSYYGMIPNENLNLFEAIEEIIEINLVE